MATVIQMPGARNRGLIRGRRAIHGLGMYQRRGLGDTVLDNTAPWYTDAKVVIPVMLIGGLALGYIARPHATRARRKAKKVASTINWGTIGSMVGSAVLGAAITKMIGGSK